MPRNYTFGHIRLIFEDDTGAIIHQNRFDLQSSGHLASFVKGSRIELTDDGKQIIGSVKDVKHVIAADSSNNFQDSVDVRCEHSHEVT
jgi:hypothetical protein